MKKQIVVGLATVGLLAVVALVQEYEPETLPGAPAQTVNTLTGYRTTFDTTVPVRTNGTTLASVVKITTCQLVMVRQYENGVLVSQRNNVEMNPVNTFAWYMAQTNASGEVIAVPLKQDGAAKF
jgi:hypothetical protein